MAIIVNKKDGEAPNAIVYRFVKKIQQSGVLRESRKRRFTQREMNKNKRRQSALHRVAKQQAYEKARKLGTN